MVKPAGRLVPHYLRQEVHGRVIGMGARRNVIRHHDHLDVSDAPERDHALPVLRGLTGICLPERVGSGTIRLGDLPERLDNELYGPLLIEFSRHDQQGVVGLVVLPVEGLEPVDRHALHVGAGADDRLPIVVPQIGGGEGALHEDTEGAVLSRLHLVPDHRHLRVEILGGDEGVDHAVGFEVEGPLQVVLRGGEGFEVVGAVVGGGAVRAGPPLRELLRDVRMVGRPLEHQVLEEVCHPGLAVRLVSRPYVVRDVDSRAGLAGVGEKEEAQAVVEAVFSDPLHLGDASNLLGRQRSGRQQGEDGQCG